MPSGDLFTRKLGVVPVLSRGHLVGYLAICHDDTGVRDALDHPDDQ